MSTRKTGKRPATRKRPTMARRRREALTYTWATIGLGTALSMAFNVRAIAEHTHEWLALVGMGLVPLVTAGLVKIMTLVSWPRTVCYGLARFAGIGGGALAGMAFSMSHSRAVFLTWTGSPMASWAGPIMIDLAMVAAGAALVAIHHPPTRKRSSRKPARRKATMPATVARAVPSLVPA